MTKEEILRTQTHKEPGLDLARRVFYTLSDLKEHQVHRASKALAMLVTHLHDKQVLNDADVDELLFEIVS